MIAVIDCNNFFVSCETVFNPSLRGKAVVVLSNNDGCVISRSQKAKDIGLKMGEPAFKIDNKDVLMCSSNYTLYGDMSRRVMTILAELLPDIYIYSIDEAFADMSGFTGEQIEIKGKEIIEKVFKFTGIPVSVGVGPNITLAKLANRYAKKYKGYRGFCAIDNDEKRVKALQMTDVGDIYGIGRSGAKVLEMAGIKSAYQFATQSDYWVRKNMKITGYRTQQELLGEKVLPLQGHSDKHSICTSRSFASGVKEYREMEEAISSFAAACAAKLRGQSSVALSVTTFIMTNFHKEDLPKYYNSTSTILPQATSNTIDIVATALNGLKQIYRKGYEYKKGGVILSEISSDKFVQQNLFTNINTEKMQHINSLLDKVNSRYGYKTLHLAVEGALNEEKGAPSGWRMRREHLSRNYTTKLAEVIEVLAK